MAGNKKAYTDIGEFLKALGRTKKGESLTWAKKARTLSGPMYTIRRFSGIAFRLKTTVHTDGTQTVTVTRPE